MPVICTLFLIPLLIARVNQSLYQLNFPLTIAYNFALVLLNDILVRSIADNLDHWVTKSFYFVLTVSTFIMIHRAFQLGDSLTSVYRNWAGRTLFILLGAALTGLCYRLWITA